MAGSERQGAPLLRLEEVSAGYGRMQVLHGVHVEVEAGETVCVIGPNGAGKSTVLKAVMGEVRILSGRVLLAGEDVTGRAPAELLRLGLAYVPQGRVVFPSLTVRENVLIGVRSLGLAPSPHDLAHVLDQFPELRPHLDRPAGLLSGGQRQLVALARALMVRPRLLLMDEPSLGLSPAAVRQLFARLDDLRRGGTAILLVEQNARQALAHADRAYVLELGRNRYEGRAGDLLRDPRVQELYLGGRGAQTGAGTATDHQGEAKRA